jgi:hypothetical protein
VEEVVVEVAEEVVKEVVNVRNAIGL